MPETIRAKGGSLEARLRKVGLRTLASVCALSLAADGAGVGGPAAAPGTLDDAFYDEFTTEFCTISRAEL